MSRDGHRRLLLQRGEVLRVRWPGRRTVPEQKASRGGDLRPAGTRASTLDSRRVAGVDDSWTWGLLNPFYWPRPSQALSGRRRGGLAARPDRPDGSARPDGPDRIGPDRIGPDGVESDQVGRSAQQSHTPWRQSASACAWRPCAADVRQQGDAGRVEQARIERGRLEDIESGA